MESSLANGTGIHSADTNKLDSKKSEKVDAELSHLDEKQCKQTKSKMKTRSTSDLPESDRFVNVTDEDLDSYANNVVTERTRLQTQWATKLFKDWLSHQGLNVNFEEYNKQELCNILAKFYPSVRNKNGETYAIQTLINARSGINRYLTMPPINYDWNIMQDKEFLRANKVFKGLRRKIKQDGNDKRKTKPIMSPKDLNKVYTTYFDLYYDKDPVCLQHKVFFDITYFLGRRGCEGLRQLTKDSFEIKTFENGREYMQLTYHPRTKKCQGDESNPYDEENIILSQPGSPRCPVNSYKLYLSKLSPNLNAIFQQPNKNFEVEPDKWYRASLLGKNKIGLFLQTICKKANLETRFTNHCLRGTAATAMMNMGYSIPEIASVTKHRNHQSLVHYLQKPSLEKRGKYSRSLFNYAADSENMGSSSMCPADMDCDGEVNQSSVPIDQSNTSSNSTTSNDDVPGNHIDNEAAAIADYDDGEISFPNLSKKHNKKINAETSAQSSSQNIMHSHNGSEVACHSLSETTCSATTQQHQTEEEIWTFDDTFSRSSSNTAQYQNMLETNVQMNEMCNHSNVNECHKVNNGLSEEMVCDSDNEQPCQTMTNIYTPCDSSVGSSDKEQLCKEMSEINSSVTDRLPINQSMSSYGSTACFMDVNGTRSKSQPPSHPPPGHNLNKEMSNKTPGLFWCAQLSNCTIHVSMSNN